MDSSSRGRNSKQSRQAKLTNQNPRETWADKGAYDRQAAKLVQMFRDNFTKFEALVGADIKDAAEAGGGG